MSVQSEINRIQNAVSDAYDSIESKGGALPSALTVGNLANAIMSIPQQSENVGKYFKNWNDGYSYSSPLLTIGTSDTDWHKLSLTIDPTHTKSEGSLLTDGLFTLSTDHVLTCQVPGVYAIEAGMGFCGESTGVIGWLLINTGTYSAIKQTQAQYWYPPSSGNHASIILFTSATVTLDVGDTIHLEGARGAGGAMRVLNDYISVTCLADLSDPSKYTKTVSDVHIAPRSAWNANTPPGLVSSNAEYSCGVDTANNYSFVDRNSKTFYLMPVDGRANHVSVEILDTSLTNYDLKICGYKSGSSLSKVFDTGYVTTNTYSWVAGNIDYITVHVRNKAGTSFSWDYSKDNIKIKFTNYAF